ncbi:MAG: hydrogenase iron-sulfur subunit [Deltaproteobacteria bacterium]|nr:hydrogenase iron-sulfur subunit [Deltaproteobacteria bacterium]MBW1921333.1 hydrogenase iron-sulfur subunit [Deltaproteobacteria bacterium]MBW1936059.1 hydrogenase iron-sulfur subunit [Deltaproteobacteria bacterium]MBW2044175.1 hydrogenase iron-sulfur subunit [Deltaproteobacteria bacterium]RLB35988.1 MAG: hydrogenase iron-sulfur subunit [Deltaproteobacteria bacterium]
MDTFEPVIVAFCCHYCAYTAADMAGTMRYSYPPNVHIIRVPCSGKVDALHIMKAFQKGADGVYVAGCLEGDCHFKTGNIKAAHMVAYLKGLLDEIGIGAERLEMFTMSAGMGERFARIATDFTERIRKLGPNPAKAGSDKTDKVAVG